MAGSPAGVQYEPQAQVAADVALLLAGAQWAAPTVHLFENNITPNKDTVVGDLTEPSYVGYSSVAITGWGTPGYNADGSITVTAENVAEFVGPALAGGPSIYGYFLKGGGAGTPLLRIVKFTNPVSLADDTRVLDVVASFVATPASRAV